MCAVEEVAVVNVGLVNEFWTDVIDKGQESPEQCRWVCDILKPFEVEDVQERLASGVYGPETPSLSIANHAKKDFLISLQSSKQMQGRITEAIVEAGSPWKREMCQNMKRTPAQFSRWQQP